ncbi:hypothetical protein [Tunicatimonas pelagia]|uniref:hypothetical protein n=1 Tax=Tunicatimonas pelagia TaxID=931531 RepID=UPI002666801F|nr:hypothetical protein [Tunicatimonas pelagia]WKN46188.1 hypothetical protein P0M28_14640 [Tunicatimonas pelagia]
MKRAWYFISFIIIALFSACSEDDAAEEPSPSPFTLTLEENVVEADYFSFNLQVTEEASGGIIYYSLADESDSVPTTSALKNAPGTQSVASSGVDPVSETFRELSPNTTYTVYAFIEVDGAEGELVSLQVTTKNSFLTLEERVVQPTLVSLSLRIKEEAGEGMVYFSIFDPSDPVPAAAELKSSQTSQSVAMKGGGFTFGNFQGLTPNTSYIVYGFMEIDGVESGAISLAVTTDN